jgi:predicted MFS family arabinose efflux permease
MTFVLGAIAIKLPTVGPDPDESQPGPKRRHRLLAAITANALTYLGHSTISTYISVMLLKAHASQGAVGPICSSSGGAGLIGLLVAGPRLDQHFRRIALAALTLVLLGIVASGALFRSCRS